MEKKMTAFESLAQHPVAPVVGGVLLAAAYLTDEPTPPSIPDGLPESTAKQWMLIYNQNQQRFARRMSMYKDLGLVLLGYASAQTVLDALPKRQAVAAFDPVRAESIRLQRGAM